MLESMGGCLNKLQILLNFWTFDLPSKKYWWGNSSDNTMLWMPSALEKNIKIVLWGGKNKYQIPSVLQRVGKSKFCS